MRFSPVSTSFPSWVRSLSHVSSSARVGGGAATTACGLARLGIEVRVLGLVGKADGKWVIDRLTSCGVDCSGLQRCGEPTGITVSASTREGPARFFLTTERTRSWRLSFARMRQPARCPTARHVHFACAPDTEADGGLFCLFAKTAVAASSIDVQSHVSWLTRPENLTILRQCDVFFPNEIEGGWISGATGAHEILQRLRDMGISGVGLKLGGKGSGAAVEPEAVYG